MAKTSRRDGNRPGSKSHRANLANLTFQKPFRYSVDDLYERLTRGESFWELVHPLYMGHLLTKADVVDLVERGLKVARGNYRTLVSDWNMKRSEYKKFLNFLHKHGLQMPFKPIRSLRIVAPGLVPGATVEASTSR